MENSLKKKIKHEFYVFLSYFLFLAFFISVFILYKQLILSEYALSTYKYSYGLVEALVLAKIIMIGEALKLGERFSYRSLIIPSLYKTVIFSLFVLFFSVLEHFVIGYFTGDNMRVVFQNLLNEGIYEVLARVLIMAFVFLFFFAFLELGSVLGETKLFNLFFRRKAS